jgi:DNA-binding response OmpR family regulator
MKRKGGALFDALASFRPLERDGKRSLSTGRPGRQRWCTASCVPTAACAGSATARSRELGANDYITKPFKLDELLAAIRKRLDA